MANYAGRCALHNLGCKVNEYETEKMARAMEEAGYEIVPFSGAADVYIINTCTVTNIADRKSRQMLHRAKRKNPEALVCACGCYVNIRGGELRKDPLIDIVLGNEEKLNVARAVEEYLKGHDPAGGKEAAEGPEAPEEAENTESTESTENTENTEGTENVFGHTRAFVKIQDGCRQFCTYCIIPYARGPLSSRDPEEVLSEIREKAEDGYQEIVLTGIHMSSYGKDKGQVPEEAILSLVKKAAEVPGIRRIRFGSLEPRLMTEAFTEGLSGIGAFCPQFHLSLQSGSDPVLRRMNRHYTAEEFAGICERIRRYFPRAAITTDIIVGFPGETEEEFLATCAFAKQVRLSRTHIFRYSRRKGTPADKMPDQIPEAVKQERAERLEQVCAELECGFAASFLGETVEVLFEERRQRDGNTYWCGYTKEYAEACLLSEESGKNSPAGEGGKSGAGDPASSGEGSFSNRIAVCRVKEVRGKTLFAECTE